MISRKHKFAMITIAVSVLAIVSLMTINNDYNKCLNNGHSISQCTGRG